MIGNRFGLADIITGTRVDYLSVCSAELTWHARHPNLAALSDRREQRSSFKNSVSSTKTISEKAVSSFHA